MQRTHAHHTMTRQRRSIPLTVSPTEIADCGRIMTQYGDGEAWGTQPGHVACLRENVARASSGLPRRVLSLLLFNGKAQRLADFIDARRRAKLGQSHAADVPAFILAETAIECEENVLEARVLAGRADRTDKLHLAEKTRTHIRELLGLEQALLDDVHGGQAA